MRHVLITKKFTHTFQLLLLALLNDQLVQSKLLRSILEYMLLDTVLSDEPEDIYLLMMQCAGTEHHSELN
jgi:hypothetical protein